jgi:hypothetical protein
MWVGGLWFPRVIEDDVMDLFLREAADRTSGRRSFGF